MLKKKKIITFLIISIILLILVVIKFNYLEKIINYKNNWFNNGKGINKVKDNVDCYPEYIYETFTDKDGNEVVIKMERKSGLIDGEDIVFYEDTAESEVIYCHFYQGIVESVDGEKILFLVDKECKNADIGEHYHDYEDVKGYVIEFNFSDYNTLHNEKFGVRDMITIDTVEIKGYKDLEKLIGKYLKVVDSEFRDNVTKILVKGLDFILGERFLEGEISKISKD